MSRKTAGLLKVSLAWLACAGMIVPANGWAADGQGQDSHQTTAAVQSTPVVQDVAMQSDGVLEGRVVDASGNPMVGAPVSVQMNQAEIASATTDKNGGFAVSGMRGGLYRLVSLQPDKGTLGDGVYRVWSRGTAPPSAQSRALIKNVQFRSTPLGSFITSPLVLTAIIATAIAVPVAIHNRDRGGQS